MSRDDPTSRFTWMAAAPCVAVWQPEDGLVDRVAVALPAAKDRVLVAIDSGVGLLDVEHAPPAETPGTEIELAGPICGVIDRLAKEAGVGIRLRVERGMGDATGIADNASIGAAALAAVGAAFEAAGHGPVSLADDDLVADLAVPVSALQRAVHGGIAGAIGDAVAWILADTKASGDDWTAAMTAASHAGAANVARLRNGPMLVAVCPDKGTAGRCKEAVIEAFAMRGIWPRGRAGAIPTTGVSLMRLD